MSLKIVALVLTYRFESAATARFSFSGVDYAGTTCCGGRPGPRCGLLVAGLLLKFGAYLSTFDATPRGHLLPNGGSVPARFSLFLTITGQSMFYKV